jgi:dimethylhistidine N-methyltransferase
MTADTEALAAFVDLETIVEDFETAVVAGLSATPKTLPCKFFYDQAGSELFSRICELDEYYPTRTEVGLLRRISGNIARLMGPDCHLIEFGSGDGIKVRLLLDAVNALAGYTAVDISRDHLKRSAEDLARLYPDIEIAAICADYTKPFDVPPPSAKADARRVGFFPGSTIGNFTPAEAVEFLRTAAKLLEGGDLIIGVDLKKDIARLESAYNDSEGVTAAFNLNLLARINRELSGDFIIDAFEHRAHYDPVAGRIEMHLISRRDQFVTVGGRRFDFAAGETIHTENSYKYAIEEFREVAANAGFKVVGGWTDDENLFSIHYLRAESAG